ncbi:MAG: hypothetical protein K2H28_07220 [Ruminococcus sp.]|nr:hypothetical protein [Ruminococcus sp.]
MTENEYREKMKELGWRDEDIEECVQMHNSKQANYEFEIPFDLFLIPYSQVTNYPSE